MNTKKDQEIYKKAVKLNPDKILNYRYVGIISTRNKNPDLAMHEIPDYVFGTNENIETKDMCDLKDIPISIYAGKGFNNRVIKLFCTYGSFDASLTEDMKLNDINTKDTTISWSDCVSSNNAYTSRADNHNYTSDGFVAVADEDIPF